MIKIREIRKARREDLPVMLEMVQHSREVMRSAGNIVQWPGNHPGKEELLDDIAKGQSYLVTEEGRPVGTFALVHGPDSTYGYIEGGLWLDDTTPYATIHRLACVPGVHGIGKACFDWCLSQAPSLRTDTHEVNATVRHIVESYGFSYCGTIYIADGTPRRAYQRMMYPQVETTLKEYVERTILPHYDTFDAAHRRDHVLRVMAQSMELAGHYPELRSDLVYAIAAYHDLGICEGRERHHLVSGRIVRNDPELRRWFSSDEIETMAQAVEDHRASATHDPRSLYGRIVAEADRDIEPLSIVRRTVQYGLTHYPELDTEGHWQRTIQHLEEKYAPGGYLKLYIPESRNAVQMQRLHELIADKARLREEFDKLRIEN